MKFLSLIATILLLISCSSKGEGQVIYHWQRNNTGVIKFSRDHSECLKSAEYFTLPDFKNWFYSEEYRYDIAVDWHKDKGIWATYIPYPGADPVIVNSIRDTANSNPKVYRECMEDKGYFHRTSNIPNITNIFIYNPQKGTDRVLF